jgi:hypothetical protein
LEEERHSKSTCQACPYLQQNPCMMQEMMDPCMMYPQQMQQPMNYPGMMGQMQQPMSYSGMMGQMYQSMGSPTGRDDEEEDVFADGGYRRRRPYYPHHGYYPYHPYYPYYPYHHGYYHHHR